MAKKSSQYRYAVFLLLFLASQGFFNPFGILSPVRIKFLFYSISLLAFVYAYTLRTPKKMGFPYLAYYIVLGGILFSMFMVQLFQRQPFSVTFVATLPYFFGYLSLYTLMKLNIPPKRIEKTLMWLTVASAIMYLANLFAFPGRIFGEEKDEVDMSRGFMRLGVPMIFLVASYFLYCVNRWMVDGKRKWIFVGLAVLVLIVMSLTRQYIVIPVVMGILFIMQKAKMWKKIVVLVVSALIYFVILPEIPIYKAMVELSENQIEMNNTKKEDVRLTGWKFFTVEFQTNEYTPLFGNGVPSLGKSRWANEVEYTLYADVGGNGCYQVDVTWPGFYWYFGGIATLCLVIIFYKSIRREKPQDREYVTYALLFCMITALASGPILVYSHIIQLNILFYLAFAEPNINYYETNRNSNTQLQQLRGYY